MERGLQEGPVEYGVWMFFPQLPEQIVSIGMNPMPFECLSIMCPYSDLTH